MPKLPRDVSNRRLARFFKKQGWQIHEGAKHTIARNGDAMVTIPRHDVIALGTLKSILSEAGIEDWSEL